MNHKFESFWQWFLFNKDLIAGIDQKNPFLKELETQIFSLGDFAWEIGAGLKKPHSFTLSPGGERNLLELTKYIISLAPVLPDWEFYYARQVKEWDNYFETIIKGEKYKIDISKWEYVLLEYEEKTFDIIIKPIPYFDQISQNYGIAEMILDSIIGEEERIEKIEYIQITKEFDLEINNSKTALINLRNHLKELSSPTR